MRTNLEVLAIEFRGQIESTRAKSTMRIEAVKQEASTWADRFKSDLFSEAKASPLPPIRNRARICARACGGDGVPFLSLPWVQQRTVASIGCDKKCACVCVCG